MRYNSPKLKRGRRGQALVPVILIMLIFTVMALSFAGSTEREISASSNFSRQVQRTLAAQGALQYALASLSQTSKNGATYGVLTPTGDTDNNGWRQIGDAWVKVDVIDTGAFLSLNGTDRTQLSVLPVFKENSDLVDAILDWKTRRDPNSRQGGSPNAEYYQSLPMPYDCKQAPYDSIEELLLVKGMTPQILYSSPAGTPLSLNGSMGQNSNGGYGVGGGMGRTRQVPSGNTGQNPNGGNPSGGNPNGGNPNGGNPNNGQNPNGNTPNNGQTDPSVEFREIFQNSQIPVAELLVPNSRERNLSVDGSPRVNLNTATLEDLTQKVGLTSAQAQTILSSQRNNANNANSGGNNPNTGGNPSGGSGGTQPRSAGITRQLSSDGGPLNSVILDSGAQNPNAPQNNPALGSLSDLFSQQGFTRRTFQQIADKVAFDDTPYRENVININTAPQEVLAMIPGMTRDALQAIMNLRQQGQVFQNIGDIFALNEIPRATLQQILPHISTKSSTYFVRIRVRVPGQLGMTVFLGMVEMTDNGGRVLQWREVPRVPGWAYWSPAPQLPMPGSGQSPEASEEPLQ
jgi:type II secretory pathway component PulK